MDWSSGIKRSSALAIKYDSTLAESVVDWRPKKSSDINSCFRIAIPRPLSLWQPRRQERASDISQLNWPRQVNPRLSDSGPSGMLLRVEKLRQAVMKMHGELQKNRFSLQVIRQDFQRSRG